MSYIGNDDEWARPEPKRKKRLDPEDWTPSYEGTAKSAAEEAADRLFDTTTAAEQLAARYKGARAAFYEDAYLASNPDGTKQGRR